MMTPPRTGRTFKILSWLIMGSLAACLGLALALQGIGFRYGSTADYRHALAYEGLPIPTLDSGTRQPLPGVTITIWFLKGPEYFDAEHIFAQELTREVNSEEQPTYYLAFDEAGFNQYMSYWYLPGNEDLKGIYEDIKNTRIDLISGGVILYADMRFGSDWKPVGLVYALDESATQLKFRGIDMDGSLVSAAPNSLLDHDVAGIIERLSNRALSDLAFIDAETQAKLVIRKIYISEDRAEVLIAP
jgi:hypothetical protein